jgi:polyphosphate kinase
MCPSEPSKERLSPALASLVAKTDQPLIHRDLSWLQFNERVLGEAQDPNNPILERLKFLSISASNLDEFFMIRFASLTRSITRAQKIQDKNLARELSLVRAVILNEVAAFKKKQKKVLAELKLALEPYRIVLHASDEPITATEQEIFSQEFVQKIPAPVPFKWTQLNYLGNLQSAVIFPNQTWIPLPTSIPRAITRWVDGDLHVWFTHHLWLKFLPAVFGQESASLLRVTRDGDLSFDIDDDDPESIPDQIRSGIGRRERGRFVRIQYSGKWSEAQITKLTQHFKLEPSAVIQSTETFGLAGLWNAMNRAQEAQRFSPPLVYPERTAEIPRGLHSQDSPFEHLKRRDFLLHHPYDSFHGLLAWIDHAATDPHVTRICITLYRTGSNSPLIASLKKAAQAGKKVDVLIELRARFDELNNLKLTEELKLAGVDVAFGFGKLKLHAKLALVSRNEESGTVLYTHVSTGNYHAGTSRLYTDLAILTGRPEFGKDALHFFDSVIAGSIPSQFKTLLPAPLKLHRRILAHIEAETKAALAGKPARIVAKVNALVDEPVIKSLYRASQAGVQIDLIVRGACSLVPGIPGLSEHIRVISVVDRYLEHSRIYYFESAKKMYLSSADWMPRNFFSRLEIAYPVLDERIYAYLKEVVIPTYLRDTVKAQELTAKGTWQKRHPEKSEMENETQAVRAQFYFEGLADRHYTGTPLEFSNTPITQDPSKS